MKTLKKILRTIAKYLVILLLALLGLFLVVVLLIRTEWAQQRIVSYATGFVSEKTGTMVTIDRLFITFTGNVQLEGLYLEDLRKDTLLYSRSLEAGVGIRSLLSGTLAISKIEWNGLQANIERGSDSTFNFDFIIEAFAGSDTTTAQTADTATSGPMNISLGPVDLSDFHIRYLDSISGIDARLDLGRLSLETNETDLQNFRFELDELGLKNTTAYVHRFLSLPPSEDTAASVMPYLSVEDLTLENIRLHYRATPDSTDARITLGRFAVEDAELDLSAQNISVNSIALLQSDIRLRLPSPARDTAMTAEVRNTTAPEPFEWPAWTIELDELEMEENHLRLDRGSGIPAARTFDPDHIGFRNFAIHLRDVSLEDRQVSLDLKGLSFTERSGFTLRQLSFDTRLEETGFEMDNFKLETGHSHLSASLAATFRNIDSLLSDPAKHSRIAFRVSDAALSLQDAFYFSDSLRHDSLMRQIARYPVKVEGSVKGQLSDIRLSEFRVQWLNDTRILIDGQVQGLPDTNELFVAIPRIVLNTTGEDLAILSDPGNGKYPDFVKLKGSLNGDARDLTAKLNVNTPDGTADLNSRIQNLAGRIPFYKGELKITSLDIGKITGNPDLDKVSLQMDFDGHGKDLETLVLDAGIRFQQLRYKNYDYSKLEIEAHAAQQKAHLTVSHTDDNLDFDLKADAFLDTSHTVAGIELDLRGADLHDLHLNTRNLKVAMDLTGSFEGTAHAFRSELSIGKAIFIQKNDSYRMDTLFARLRNDTNLTDLEVESPVLRGDLQANTSLQTLATSLQAYLANIIDKDSLSADSIYTGLDMHGNFVIADSPLLGELFLPGLTRMDTIKISTHFKPGDQILDLALSVPEVVYKGSELAGLQLTVDAGGDTTRLDLDFEHLYSNPLRMYQTKFRYNLSGNTGMASLQVLDSVQEEVFYTSLNIETSEQETNLHVNPDHLTLNRNPWDIAANNVIHLNGNLTVFENFRLHRNDQLVQITSQQEGKEMLLDFRNFNMDALFSLLNPHQSPLSGTLSGNVKLTNLDKTPAFEADLKLDPLGLTGHTLGALTLKGNSLQTNRYEVSMTVKGDDLDLAVKGTYSTAGESQNMDFGINLNRLNLALAQAFAPDQLEKTKGYLSGQFTVTGPADDMRYEGILKFNNARLTPVMLGTAFTFPSEEIEINNQAIRFNNFTLVDANGSKTVIDGKVGTTDLMNPTFDLSVRSKEFRILNSTAKDNELYYGTAIIDLDVNLKGDLNLPVAEAQIKLKEGTDITYVVPASQAQIQERAGIVRFRNMKDSTNVLNEEAETTTLSGMDVSAYLQVASGTRFTVVIDPQSGDHLTVAGEANLNLEINPNGSISLNGGYELSDGSYKMSLYELVKKEFQIVEGSRIDWSGDPMAADLDITAIYKIKASTTDLFANQLQGADASTINRYRQKVPFEVMLYIDGSIDQPRISFGLDMPDESKGALGGAVYSRIRQLNEDESQLNKQVFSLIVFNKFLPSDVAAEGGGGTSELARSSVSKLLSSQLNQLSERYIQGVELNFDLDSYTDYQTGAAQQRTDLNVSLRKGFLDDRVIVEVGSQVGVEGARQSNEVVGDVSVEYLLTESGQYRLRAFRKNQYQDIIEGQVVITGLAILFSKEFDNFREMLRKNKIGKATKDEEEDRNEN